MARESKRRRDEAAIESRVVAMKILRSWAYRRGREFASARQLEVFLP